MSSNKTRHRPNVLTTQAELATTRAANIGGTKRSILERWKNLAGKHTVSDGRSTGTLKLLSELQVVENDDEGDIAHIKAVSGANAAKATVTVRRAVHTPAYINSGRRHALNVQCESMELMRRKADILIYGRGKW